jgi:hypothetical protein
MKQRAVRLLTASTALDGERVVSLRELPVRSVAQAGAQTRITVCVRFIDSIATDDGQLFFCWNRILDWG